MRVSIGRVPAQLLFVLLALGALGSCQRGAPSRFAGEGPVVLRAWPEDGAAALGRYPVFLLDYDRPLAPRAVLDASAAIRSGGVSFPVRVAFDPWLERLEVRADWLLDPEADYRLEVAAMPDLDGRLGEPVTILFSTARDTTPPPDVVVGWEAVAPIFAACAECHDGPAAPLGLELGSPEAVAATALAVPALGVLPSGSVDEATPGLYGLSRIEPGAPERSYLVYKLIGDPHVSGAREPNGRTPLGDAEMRAMIDWIRSGAPL